MNTYKRPRSIPRFQHKHRLIPRKTNAVYKAGDIINIDYSPPGHKPNSYKGGQAQLRNTAADDERKKPNEGLRGFCVAIRNQYIEAFGEDCGPKEYELLHTRISELKEFGLPQELVCGLTQLANLKETNPQRYYEGFQYDFDERIVIIYFFHMLYGKWWLIGGLGFKFGQFIKYIGEHQTGPLNHYLLAEIEDLLDDYMRAFS